MLRYIRDVSQPSLLSLPEFFRIDDGAVDPHSSLDCPIESKYPVKDVILHNMGVGEEKHVRSFEDGIWSHYQT